MSDIAVTKLKQNGTESASLLEHRKALASRVRQRAYELFRRRDEAAGSGVDDWLKAERELIWAPDSDLVEKNGYLHLQIALPGFDAKSISVTAFADALTVNADSTHKHEDREANVYFCEFGERTLFRKFDLPSPIDVDSVTAQFENGMLQVSAVKKEAAPKKLITAA